MAFIRDNCSSFVLLSYVVSSIIFVVMLSPAFAYNFALKGSKLSCSREGQVMVIPFLKQDNPCITCICQNLVVDCFKMPGKCCGKTCGQVGASCMVNGDAMQWVTTYDGKRYRLEGKCNYVLTRHCDTKHFSIHLINKFGKATTDTDTDAGSKVIFEGTSLMVKLEETKIYLSHLGRVRVNRSLVSLPYIELGHFSIAKFGNQIKLRAIKMEFEILWAANSSVEVKVKNKHQSRMCGLCGNFNHDPEDEFQLKRSKQIASVDKFIKSYRVGQNLVCRKKLPWKRMQVSEPLPPSAL